MTTPATQVPDGAAFPLLTLDGGGSKGFYTLGVLKELEGLLKPPLADRFRLVFGTSTGAIIGALIALGMCIDDIHALYREYVPTIMKAWPSSARSRALGKLARTVFGDARFDQVKTGLGVVAARWDFETPMIFKAGVEQAHGRRPTFVPGFGCTIAEAVEASCSAYPFFARKSLTTSSRDRVELVDGGYCANNPLLYAIADARSAFGKGDKELRAVSVGVGVYPEPKRRGLPWLIRKFPSVKLLQKTLDINTLSMEKLRMVLFPAVPTVRINAVYERPEMATDLMETDLKKLNLLYQRGRQSFATHEGQLRALLLDT